MDDDDNDELLQLSEDESMTESEETCQSLDKPNEPQPHLTFDYTSHTAGEFVTTQLVLIFSSTLLLILLPGYQESVNIRGSTYTIALFNTCASFIAMFLILLLNQKLCPLINEVKYSTSPLKYSQLLISAMVYTASGFVIIYALDRKHVLCHLQDPMKGLILVFSLIYYFFFCKKLMGLQRIFSSTTVIVGLFISIDYGLCNEFRCRGHEREKKSDDAGTWSWQIHSAWSAAYIIGLAGFAAFYMLLDRFIVTANEIANYESLSSQFLSTISRLVSFQNNNTPMNGRQVQQLTTPPCNSTMGSTKEYSAIHIALWLHFMMIILVVLLFWVDLLPHIGSNTSLAQFINGTVSGIGCAFAVPKYAEASLTNCGNTSVYAWLFMVGYVIFTISSLRFLILCQSAVHTIATMTVALPISGLWWSLFKFVDVEKGLLIWYPTLSGELICALLGLPIIVIGLGLLTKSHFTDWQMARSMSATTLRCRHLA